MVSLPCPFRYMESALAEKLVPGMVSKHSKIVSGCRSDSIRILCTETSKSPFRSRVIVVVSLLSNLSKNIYCQKIPKADQKYHPLVLSFFCRFRTITRMVLKYTFEHLLKNPDHCKNLVTVFVLYSFDSRKERTISGM